MKFLLLLPPLILSVRAATTVLPGTYTVSTAIPDSSLIGVADTRTVTTSLTSITGLGVALTLTGGWNGDLYAYLVHNGGFSVLLNRVGRTSGVPDGSGASGFNVFFTTGTAPDIHTSAGPFTAGAFQPDARRADPTVALDTSPRTAFLDTFVGLDPNGEWTLFVADVAPGGTAFFQSWSLEITGVPEPSVWLITSLVLVPVVNRRRRDGR